METIVTVYEISDRLFVLLFFPAMAVFFWGINLLWRTSLESREQKRKSGS